MKKLISIILAAAMCMSLAACGIAPTVNNDRSKNEKNSLLDSIVEKIGKSEKTNKANKGDKFNVEDVDITEISVDSFVGNWEYWEYDIGYIINSDLTFEYCTTDGRYEGGEWEPVNTGIALTFAGDYESIELELNEDGDLVDSDGDALFKVEEFSFNPGFNGGENQDSEDCEAFVGYWEYTDYASCSITIYDDHTFYASMANEIEGYYRLDAPDSGKIVLYTDDDEEFLTLEFAHEDVLMDGDGDFLVRR